MGSFFLLDLDLAFFEEDLDSDLDLPTYGGLGLEDSGLGLGCCWTCYKSASAPTLHKSKLHVICPNLLPNFALTDLHWVTSPFVNRQHDT